jgi:hypothetical protein
VLHRTTHGQVSIVTTLVTFKVLLSHEVGPSIALSTRNTLILGNTIVVEVFVSVIAPTLTVIIVDEDCHVLPIDLSESEGPFALGW